MAYIKDGTLLKGGFEAEELRKKALRYWLLGKASFTNAHIQVHTYYVFILRQ